MLGNYRKFSNLLLNLDLIESIELSKKSKISLSPAKTSLSYKAKGRDSQKGLNKILEYENGIVKLIMEEIEDDHVVGTTRNRVCTIGDVLSNELKQDSNSEIKASDLYIDVQCIEVSFNIIAEITMKSGKTHFVNINESSWRKFGLVCSSEQAEKFDEIFLDKLNKAHPAFFKLSNVHAYCENLITFDGIDPLGHNKDNKILIPLEELNSDEFNKFVDLHKYCIFDHWIKHSIYNN